MLFAVVARVVADVFRRVRCDLKDLPFGSAGPHPACSNCKERGLKCVYGHPLPALIDLRVLIPVIYRDEFADVKAVKLLRRGRRLQQVECVRQS